MIALGASLRRPSPRARHIRIPVIAPSALGAYLAREFNDYEFLKRVPDVDLRTELNALGHRFVTDPRNAQLVCSMVGTYEPAFLFFLDMGAGKALAHDELVLTPHGFKELDTIKVGDHVIGVDGKPTKVLGVYPQGKKELYTVRFSDGAEVRCCENHLWAVSTATGKWLGNKFHIRSLKEIVGRGLFGLPSGNRKNFIPNSAPVQFDKGPPLPLDPYFLGVLLGDGSITQTPSLSTSDQEILDRIRPELPPGIIIVKYSKYGYGFTRGYKTKTKNPLQAILEQLGVWGKTAHTKSVPQSYLLSSVEDRLSLLRGLLDTDGTVGKTGKDPSFTSVSIRLARDVCFLVRSLGGTARLRKGRVAYTVGIRMPHGVIPFALKKKANRAAMAKQKYGPNRAIVSVERIGEEDAICIKVEAEDGLFLTRDFIVTHNTKLMLDLIRYRKRRGELQRALVLVPYLFHADSWANELKMHAPDLRYTLLLGSKSEREMLLAEKSDVCVINHAGLSVYMGQRSASKDTEKMKLHVNADAAADFARHFNFFTIDESHRLGNHNSLLWKLCSWLSLQCDFKYATTGTPFGRDPAKLWPQFRLIDQGETLGNTLTLFRLVFFTAMKDYWSGIKWEFNEKMLSELTRVIKHKSITFTEKELTDLPPMVKIKVPIRLTEEGRDYYRRITQKLMEAHGDYTSLKNPFLRMRQVCGAFLSLRADDDSRVQLKFKVNPKLDALRQLLLDKPEASKMLLYYQYTPSGMWIAEMLKEMKIPFAWLWGGAKNPGAEYQRFLNDPKCRIFLLQNDLGSEVINPQYVCHYGAVYESPVDPIKRAQLEKRLKRPGQEHVTFLYDFVVQNTIEEKILEYVKEGRDLMKAILEGSEALIDEPAELH